MLDLDKRSIMYLPGVGPKKAEILQKEAGISSYEDMLFYFPYKYIDRSRFYKVAEVTGDMPYIQMKGRILFFDTVGEGRTRRLIGKFTDGTGTIDLVWFKGINYVLDKIKTGVDYIVFGKPTEFGHIYNIPHPDIDPLDQADKVANGLTPFYNTSEKMKKSFLNSRAIQNLQYTLLSGLNWTLPETLPPDVLNRIRMMSFPEAIRNVHFPESVDKLRKAQLRLKFDELFFIQLNILRTSNLRKLKLRGIVFPSVGDYFNTFYKEYLPFELTNAQKRVVREIRADMGSGRQMNRLLQGDVGSGKTLVALLSMLLAVDNHCQACMMAPTVIEVGVNVPNASVMVIESAERFGLSQLHQLRGRVGRGAEQSYCVLVSSYKLSNETRKRLEIMVSSNNGFEIAEADLRLRGHGDLEGTRQSGEGIDLKIANLAADGQILQYARDIAQDVLNEDPDLLSEPNRILNERLKTLFAKKVNWGMIS